MVELQRYKPATGFYLPVVKNEKNRSNGTGTPLTTLAGGRKASMCSCRNFRSESFYKSASVEFALLAIFGSLALEKNCHIEVPCPKRQDVHLQTED